MKNIISGGIAFVLLYHADKLWPWMDARMNMGGENGESTGDCSRFKGNIPHCCEKTPTVVEMLPGVVYSQRFLPAAKVESWSPGIKIQDLLSIHCK
ncbi:hypothetical protein Leryth_016710 [Lithospermum erythrorhizon]|nr:hypothetical protein Leryth_016710 [Lithospermum erythrorhizon]